MAATTKDSGTFTAWESVKDELDALDTSANSAGSGTVTIGGGDKVMSAVELANVAVNGYTISLDDSVLKAQGFVSAATSKDHEKSVSVDEVEAMAGKANSSSSSQVESGGDLSRVTCRAAAFARIVSLTLARSGVRAPLLTLLVDMMNANVVPAFSSEASAGKELCLALLGSDKVQVYSPNSSTKTTTAAAALQAAALAPLEKLSPLEAASVVQGEFLTTGGACLLALGAQNALQALDGVSALSCEALGSNTNSFSAEQFEQARQHRGQITSSLNMRLLLEGSKRTGVGEVKGDACVPFLTIPQVHGPACDAISVAVKAAELELNSSELGPIRENDVGLNASQMLLVSQSVSAAVHLVSLSSAARIAVLHGDRRAAAAVPPACSFGGDFASILSQIVALSVLARQELVQTLSILTGLEEAAKEKEKEKEAKAAAAAQENEKKKPAQDESNWTPAQKAKAEAARKKKEEKAAAKAAAKGSKSGIVLGAGTGALRTTIKSASASMQDLATLLNPFNNSESSLAAQCAALLERLNSGGKRRPKVAKGTRDYGPEQMRIRQEVFSTIRKVFKRHGGVEIDTPVFELKEVLTGKYGEDTKLIYDLADQGGEFLALRYDLTVPFARFLAMNSVGNIKRYHIAKVYRRDQPVMAKGRYREFYQCDFDIAGSYSAMTADAEAITVGCEILTALPVGNICVKLNHRVLLDAIFEIAGVPADKFRAICSAVDKLDKATWEEVRREMVEEKGLPLEIAEKVGKFVQHTSAVGQPRELWQKFTDENIFGDHQKAAEAMREMDLLFTYLEAMGSVDYISFDMSLARGLDYYTGPIYEIVVLEGTTPVGSISAGGRYDNLVGMFSTSGAQTPCVGISIGIERVFTIMEKKAVEKKLLSADETEVYIASIGANTLAHRMRIARGMWRADISAEYSHKENPKLKPQMDEVLERDIPYMVVFGDDEIAKGVVQLKNMRERTEKEVAIDDLAKTLLEAGCSTVGSSNNDFMEKLRD